MTSYLRGNYAGVRPYLTGTPCTQCESGIGQCYGNQCRKYNHSTTWYNKQPGVISSTQILSASEYNGKNYIMGVCGVSWPSGLACRTQVLVLVAECGFESRP